MLNLVKGRRWYFLGSGIAVLVGLILLFVPPGLKWGIEFTAGSTMTVQVPETATQAELRTALSELGHPEAIIQGTGGGSYLVRLTEINTEEETALETSLKDRLNAQVLDFYAVSPLVAGEIRRNAAIAVAVALVGILVYMAWAFRKMPSPWRWGTCAAAVLVHDVLILLGAFALLGRLFNVQVDALFISAALAVVGYGVNNVCVVFDRVRENLTRGTSRDLETVVNRSLVETLGRQLNTTLTVLLTVTAVYLLGGQTIHTFMLALLIGVAVGAYSSLLLASQLLVAWEKRALTGRR